MADPNQPLTVAALYRFATLPDPQALRGPLLDLCIGSNIKGTLLLAHEGVNGTIAGTPESVGLVTDHIRAWPGCADLDIKYSTAPTMPFGRMKVKVKPEIVTMGVPDLDPAAKTGIHLDPQDWNALLADPDVVLIDTRNSYEIGIGTFTGAIDPGTRSFREFPGWFDAQAERWAAEERSPKIAMFCTGGIRCEKSTAYAKARGFDQVYHLKGGILRYLEDMPQAQSRWQGDCYVFDDRVAVSHGLAPGDHALCRNCGNPIVRGEDCATCA